MINTNIIFFDIDGTLLSDKDFTIPKSTIKALSLLKEKGNLAFINTGRPPSEITKIIRDLDFDGYICGCGTYVEYHNEVLLYKSIGSDKTAQIAKDIVNCKLEAILEGRYGIYFDVPENIHNELILQIIDQHKIEGFYSPKTWYEEDIDMDKFVIFLNEDSDFDSFYDKYNNEFDFIKRSDTFYEVVPKNYSKASGIKFIINKLDIPHDNTYAIGDSTNDLPMLQYAKTSIAMGNSTESIFKDVSYITSTLEEDGIYNALKHFDLI